MIVAIASGKGGTGKTTVAVNMALSLENVQLLDCDVEQPNAHLLLHPTTEREEEVYVPTPTIDESMCDHCGQCGKFCQYNAIFVSPKEVVLFTDQCHSCGGCTIICPKAAVSEVQHRIGKLKYGSNEGVEIVSGELNVGEPIAVPVIRAVKRQIKKGKTVILDSPPGTSCPVMEAVAGSDFCVLVTEPTPFGLHDLRIAMQVLKELAIPFGVVVNRAGIGTRAVDEYCKANNIPILLEIPYQRRIAELYSKGIPFIVEMPEWKERFQALFHETIGLAGK
jgi:MinD superfamily P-loop ATPase